MSTYSFERGQRLDVVLRGYFVYSMSGYTRIALEPLSDDKEDMGGENTLEIVDGFFVSEPTEAPSWDENTMLKWMPYDPINSDQPYLLFVYRFDGKHNNELPYELVNTSNRYSEQGVEQAFGGGKMRPLYVEGLDD